MSNLSNETRKLICNNLESGRGDITQTAATFGVSYCTVQRIWTRFCKEGDHKGRRSREVIGRN